MKNLNIDGTEYRVKLVYGSLQRSFTITEGTNSGVAITGRAIRDIIGTSYSYSVDVEPDPAHPEDYDAMYEVLTSPVDYHTVVMPYGQSTLTFEAMITSGSDSLGANIRGVKRWNGMRLQFIAREPQRSVFNA